MRIGKTEINAAIGVAAAVGAYFIGWIDGKEAWMAVQAALAVVFLGHRITRAAKPAE